ncbi:transposase, IS256 family [Segatella oris C735]|uniref:Transposase, IS256 family n=1 Tax=Segatella oris C735 TaxID=563008 RepID=D7N9E8_9BACT|nr:transposase, IS256 family [Segatella oris C735]
MDNKEIDYKRAAEQLRNGEPLFGKDGALAPMLEHILDAALEGEMDAHLS